MQTRWHDTAGNDCCVSDRSYTHTLLNRPPRDREADYIGHETTNHPRNRSATAASNRSRLLFLFVLCNLLFLLLCLGLRR